MHFQWANVSLNLGKSKNIPYAFSVGKCVSQFRKVEKLNHLLSVIFEREKGHYHTTQHECNDQNLSISTKTEKPEMPKKLHLTTFSSH